MRAASFAVLHVHPRMARPLWFGHPWVRDDMVARVDGAPAPGDVVRVVDEHGQTIDFALWSGQSRLRARTIGVGADWPDAWPHPALPAAFWDERVSRARSLRGGLGLPSDDTDCYRLLNAEGDATPGVIVDVYGATAVVHVTTAGAAPHVRAIGEALHRAGVASSAWYQFDARQSSNEGIAAESGVLFGDPPEEVVVVERGTRFAVRPGGQQKTGHYCDQRDNRAWFGAAARGRRCLDAHAYTGGFALAAARGGAASVLAVDSSAPALDTALANAALNGVADRFEVRRGKVEAELKRCAEAGERFDLVSLDPPKLAASRRDAEAALRKYEALCIDGLRVLDADGLLMVASCSHAIGADDLKQALASAGGRTQRRLDVVATLEQPADHPYPAAMREGRYLSAVVVRAGAAPTKSPPN